MEFFNITSHSSCKEQDIQICAAKLNLTNINIVIISIYRSPSGNYSYFFLNIRLNFEPTAQ
jgi:hypothetical protein